MPAFNFSCKPLFFLKRLLYYDLKFYTVWFVLFQTFLAEILPQIGYFCSWPLFYLLIFLSALKVWGFRGLFLFVCVFPSFCLNMVTLSFDGYSFKSSLSYFPKASLPWRIGKCPIWKRCPFSMEKTKVKCLLFTGKQHIFTCLNMLLGLHVPIVHCLAGRAAFCTVWSVLHLNQQPKILRREYKGIDTFCKAVPC